jgi:hypothetical protein
MTILFTIFYFLYDYLSNENKNKNKNKNKNENNDIPINQLNKHKKLTDNIINVVSNNLNSNIATINLDSITKNIMLSEENPFSETTSKLIDNSYNDLLNNMYVNMFMKISFDHMGTTKFVNFNLKLTKDSIYTNNFIELIRKYIGTHVFTYNYSNKIMFLGDCYNNNGSANYDANNSLLKINYVKPKFIPANTICYIVEKHDDSYYIGSQFVILLQNINNTTKIINNSIKENDFFKKYINSSNCNNSLLDTINLVPFCTLDVSNDDIKFIEIFYNNDLNKTKPKITLINNANNDDYFNNLF